MKRFTKNLLLAVFMAFAMMFTSVTTADAGYFATKFKISAPNGYKDEAVVRFADPATDEFDSKYDAWKGITNYPVPFIYSKTVSGGLLSINTLSSFNKNFNVTIHTRVPVAGIYTITYIEIAPFASTTAGILEDKLTGQSVDIRTNPVFTFTADPATHSYDRFVLHLTEPSFDQLAYTSIAREDFSDDVDDGVTGLSDKSIKDFTVYPNPTENNFNINKPDLVSVTVFDIQGRTMSIVTAKSDSGMWVDAENLTAGLYFVKAEDNRGEMYLCKVEKR